MLLSGFRCALKDCGLGNTPASCRIDDTLKSLAQTIDEGDGSGSFSANPDIETGDESIDTDDEKDTGNAFSFAGDF